MINDDRQLTEAYSTWLMEISALLMVFPWLDQAISHTPENLHDWNIPFSCWIMATGFFVLALSVRTGPRKSNWEHLIYLAFAAVLVVGIEVEALVISQIIDHFHPIKMKPVTERFFGAILGTFVVTIVCSYFYSLILRESNAEQVASSPIL